MIRFTCRGKVKRMLCLGVALLVIVELIKLSVTVGIRGTTELPADDASVSNEQIWPFPKGLDDDIEEMTKDELKSEKPAGHGHAGSTGGKGKKPADHGHAGSKDGKTEKVAGHGHAGSTGGKGKKPADHGHAGSKGGKGKKPADHGHAGSKGGKSEKAADHGHAASKEKKEEEDPREMEREFKEEEEVEFLGKLLSRDDKIVPDVDKLTGSEMDGNPEEKQAEKEEQSEEDAVDKRQLKFLEKMQESNKGSDHGKAKEKSYDKARGKVGVPATRVVKERKSTLKDTEEFEKNAEEEKEAGGEQEKNEDDEVEALEKPEEESPVITKTSNPTDISDDRIHVDTSRPVVNRHPFRYLIRAADVCKGSKVFVFCYVQSAVQNHKRRERIRQTWGNRKNYPGIEVRVVFFVGEPSLDISDGRHIQQDLLVESKKHGDIVQEDFLDVRENLSHKGVGALKWVSTYCNHAAYVLKTDDDMFVNMYVILNHLRKLHAENFRRRLLLCYVYWHVNFDRDAEDPDGYFEENIYPPYCSGMGFVMTTDVAVALYEVSRYVRFFAVNEVFIGGVLPAALEGAVNHTSWARTYCAEHEMGIYTHPTEWYKYTFTHTHDGKLIVETWKGLSDIVRNQTIPRPSVIRPGLLADKYKSLLSLFPPPES